MTKYPTHHPTMPLSIFLIIAVVAGFSSCGILSSEDPPELEPGPRNYSWTVDSVYSAPGGWMNTIWGSSPDDVWIGSSGGYEKLWHFNGHEWAPYSPRFVGDFYSIYGFAQDDIWMGGGDGEIWHFDGQEWGLFYTYHPDGMGGPNIYDIWGTSSSDIYAVGSVPPGQKGPYNGFILHYNGNQWQELILTDFGMQFQRIRKNNEGIYLYGFGPYSTQATSDTVSFYKFNKKNLFEIYSMPVNVTGSPGINTFGDKLYAVVENEVMEVHNTNFKSILSFDEREIFGVNGRHAKDIFILSSNVVMHYNGVDTRDLFQLDSQNATLWSSLVFENDVFFLVNDYDAGTNLIYHGTLSEHEPEEE